MKRIVLKESELVNLINTIINEQQAPKIQPLQEKLWWNYNKCKCESTTMMPDDSLVTYKACCGGSGAPCSSRWDCPKKRKGGMLAVNPKDSMNKGINESKTTSKLKFNKQSRKKGAKTDVYNVVKGGTTIGQVKWSSRLRGYGFLPPDGDESEVKEFVKDVSKTHREKNKNK